MTVLTVENVTEVEENPVENVENSVYKRYISAKRREYTGIFPEVIHRIHRWGVENFFRIFGYMDFTPLPVSPSNSGKKQNVFSPEKQEEKSPALTADNPAPAGSYFRYATKKQRRHRSERPFRVSAASTVRTAQKKRFFSESGTHQNRKDPISGYTGYRIVRAAPATTVSAG